jgi:uncharacterized membrane protein YeaQ/YmgE (transglycosylase-associated protein family)
LVVGALAGLYLGGIIGGVLGAFVGLILHPRRWSDAFYTAFFSVLGAAAAWIAFTRYGVIFGGTLGIADGARIGAFVGLIAGIVAGTLAASRRQIGMIFSAIGTAVGTAIFEAYFFPYATSSRGVALGLVFGPLDRDPVWVSRSGRNGDEKEAGVKTDRLRFLAKVHFYVDERQKRECCVRSDSSEGR